MKQTLALLTLFLVSSLTAVAAGPLTKQDRIEYSALKMYESQPATDTAVVAVKNGYVMSRTQLRSYVEVKDEKWNAESDGQPIESTSRLSQLKSFFTDFMQLKHHAVEAKKNGVANEELKRLQLRRESSVRLGQELKASLQNSQETEPIRLKNLKTCSESLTELEGSYLDQSVNFTLPSTKSEPRQQTAVLTAHGLKLEETEGFVQTGGSRLAEYQTTRSKLSSLKKTNVKRPVVGASLIRRFAAQLPHKDTSQAEQTKLEASLKSAWFLSQSLGSCCADRTCRDSLRSTTSFQGTGGLSPYGAK